MFVLYLGSVGLLVFTLGAGIAGWWLRKNPSGVNAEKASRVMHSIFLAGLVTPFFISLVFPGLPQLDELVGLNSLPFKSLFLIIGIILAAPGLYFLGKSRRLLRAQESSANALRLTEQIVDTDIYQRTRNPMSLGYYLWTLGLGFILGSTLVTLVIFLGFIPAHLFFLKFFEELELELRFGDAYKQYKEKVPFLIPKFSAD